MASSSFLHFDDYLWISLHRRLWFHLHIHFFHPLFRIPITFVITPNTKSSPPIYWSYMYWRMNIDMLVKKTCTSNKKLGCEELITYIQYRTRKKNSNCSIVIFKLRRKAISSKQTTFVPLALSFFYWQRISL